MHSTESNVLSINVFTDALCLVENDLSKVEDVLSAIEDTLWVVVVTVLTLVDTCVTLVKDKSDKSVVVAFVVILS